LTTFLFIILPYLTVLVFLTGIVFRINDWRRTPSPGRMTLFPAPSKGAGTFWGVMRESFLFSGLFKGDRTLWSFAWVFHVALLLIFVGHIRVFTDFPALWAALNINADTMSANFGGVAGVIVALAALLLLVRRVGLTRVREITNSADFFALLLILAIIMTGNMMRFGEHFDLELTRSYFAGLTSFSLTGIEVPASGMFRAHFLLAQLLIIYIPFSKLMHLGGIFFTQTLVQRS